jgi:hypothetical protein
VQIDRSFREATAGSLLQRQIPIGKKKDRYRLDAGPQTWSVVERGLASLAFGRARARLPRSKLRKSLALSALPLSPLPFAPPACGVKSSDLIGLLQCVVSMLKYKNKGTGEYKIGLDFFT